MKVFNVFQRKIFPMILLLFIFFILKSVLFLIPQSKTFTLYKSKSVSNFNKPSSIKNCYTLDELDAKSSNIEYIEDKINFKFDKTNLNFKKPVILSTGRIYIPFNEFIKYFEAEKVKYNIEIKPLENSIYINNKIYTLHSNKIEYNGDLYLSIFDCTKIFNLVTSWNYDKKSVTFYHNISSPNFAPKNDTGQKALVRLEDFMASKDSIDLEKTRLIVDYLYENNIPIHLSWIPKYLNPVKKIINDPTKNYCLYNLEFLYTLDYTLDKNGLIGLHGYTHQFNYGISSEDFEFGDNSNNTPKKTRALIENSIESAKELNIPISYFEFPHYTATDEQFKIAEEYFDILYENLPKRSEQFQVERVNKDNRVISYIPTPFYYPKKIDGSDEVKKFDEITNESLISFFIHPILEFKSIKRISSKDSYPKYEYSSNSALHNIIQNLKSRDVTFTDILKIK
jgi:hypothetical protein